MSSVFAVDPEPVTGPPTNEDRLVRLAVALGACEIGGPLAPAELALIERVLGLVPASAPSELNGARAAIAAGGDPLGERFYALRAADVRRKDGAVYTPPELVAPMVTWTLGQDPVRVVDAGAGSGRFSALIARRAPDVGVVAIDCDPVATLMSRAALAVIGHERATVLCSDYTRLELPTTDGRTAFLGNPPYVRHHVLTPAIKAWAQGAARELGHGGSGLAGLHAYFFLATAHLGRAGDVGCFVTSAEWLDVNYGAIVRELLLRALGGEAIHVLEPESLPFENTATTAAIACFRISEQPESVRFRAVHSLTAIADLATEGQ